MGSNPSLAAKENSEHQKVFAIFWQRMRDSNPHKRSQSPVCYRYTNPLCVKHGYYYTEHTAKVKHFFPFLRYFYLRTKPVCPEIFFLFILLCKRLSRKYHLAQKAEGFLLPFFFEHRQNKGQLLECLRVHEIALPATL